MNRRAFVLGAVLVLLGNAIAVALRAYAEAAFLAAYGPARVPYLLIANAGGFAVATLGYDAWTRRAPARGVDLGLLGAVAATAIAAPSLLAAGIPPVVMVIALIAVSQVVALALWNRVAAAVAGREARRMLPRAGAAATAGGAIAGLGAGALIPQLGTAAIPAIAAGVAVVAICVCVAQQRALAAGGAPGAAAPAGASDALGTPQRALLTGLVAVALLEAIVSTTIDLQFAAGLKHRFVGDSLAIAVSLFYGGTNAVLLVLQVAAVPRLLVTRSLPFSAAIHPALVIAWYALYAVVPGFALLAATRTSDQVLHLATSRTTQELALSAFPPEPRARWKVLLRGAITPAGICATAIALLIAGRAAIEDRVALAVVAIAIAAAWAIAARRMARRFQRALAAPLGVMRMRRDAPIGIDLDTLERWTIAAGTPDPRGAALARAVLARARVRADDLADHLRHDSPGVRAALFEQLARSPTPALRGELRAAVAIEDDDRAFALGVKALAVAGDDSALARGRGRAALCDEVALAVRTAEHMLRGTELIGELGGLCARDPSWAVALVRAHRAALPDATLAAALHDAAADPARRAGALAVIARVGPAAAVPALIDALVAGDPAAVSAIAELDDAGATQLAAAVVGVPALARAAVARALAGAPAATALLAAVLGDRDPEVAHAALRAALAVARGGGAVPPAPIAAASDAALAAMVAYLDARDDLAASAAWTACARAELDVATRRCAARLLWGAAVEVAAAGGDPAPLAATARHLTGDRDADRRRALDVTQELATTRPAMLAVIERWLGAARSLTAPPHPLARHDPWLAALVRGDHAALEPTLITLRRAPLFASVAGPALAELAARATCRPVTGELFAFGDAGTEMFVVNSGALVAHRPGQPDRALAPGSVVGEVAVLTHAPRATTAVATAADTAVLAIDRDAFAIVARRAPELVLGLAATLASWLAPERPDVL